MADWYKLLNIKDKTKGKKRWALNCEKLQKENPKW